MVKMEKKNKEKKINKKSPHELVPCTRNEAERESKSRCGGRLALFISPLTPQIATKVARKIDQRRDKRANTEGNTQIWRIMSCLLVRYPACNPLFIPPSAISTNTAGLGAMGYGMAGNVRKNMAPSGVLYVYDVASSACERFAEEFRSLGSIEIVKTPLEGAERSTTVISMVPHGGNVREIYLDGKGPVVGASPADRLFLECSTIDVQTTRAVGKEIMQRGLGHYVDAPVSVSRREFPFFLSVFFSFFSSSKHILTG